MWTACLRTYGRIDVLTTLSGSPRRTNVVEVRSPIEPRVSPSILQGRLPRHSVIRRWRGRVGARSSYLPPIRHQIRHLGISYVTRHDPRAAMNQMTRPTAVRVRAEHIRATPFCRTEKTPMVEHSAGLRRATPRATSRAIGALSKRASSEGHMGEACMSPTPRCFSPPTNQYSQPAFELGRWRRYAQGVIPAVVLRKQGPIPQRS